MAQIHLSDISSEAGEGGALSIQESNVFLSSSVWTSDISSYNFYYLIPCLKVKYWTMVVPPPHYILHFLKTIPTRKQVLLNHFTLTSES